jgi:trk system potassium uptake protein TrkH
VVLLRRTISLETVFRSTAIAVVAGLAIFLGTAALMMLQSQPSGQLAFEAVSAFGTVGLSLGATPHLETPAKLVVVLLMIAGRIGPLSLALLFGRKLQSAVRHPEARIMVG